MTVFTEEKSIPLIQPHEHSASFEALMDAALDMRQEKISSDTFQQLTQTHSQNNTHLPATTSCKQKNATAPKIAEKRNCIKRKRSVTKSTRSPTLSPVNKSSADDLSALSLVAKNQHALDVSEFNASTMREQEGANGPSSSEMNNATLEVEIENKGVSVSFSSQEHASTGTTSSSVRLDPTAAIIYDDAYRLDIWNKENALQNNDGLARHRTPQHSHPSISSFQFASFSDSSHGAHSATTVPATTAPVAFNRQYTSYGTEDVRMVGENLVVKKKKMSPKSTDIFEQIYSAGLILPGEEEFQEMATRTMEQIDVLKDF